MEKILCGNCMFWLPIEKCTKAGVQLGECRRYPTPPVAERTKTFWCGEAIDSGISPRGGRNRG